MIKIIHMMSGNIIAAYILRQIPVFEKIYRNTASLSPEALEAQRTQFNVQRVAPAIEYNIKVRKQIDSTLAQFGGLVDIDTGDTDFYCPPDVVTLES